MSEAHDAMLWQPADENKVRCDLCAHRCTTPNARNDAGSANQTGHVMRIMTVKVTPKTPKA